MRQSVPAYGVLSILGYASRWPYDLGRAYQIPALDKHIPALTVGAALAEQLAQGAIAKRERSASRAKHTSSQNFRRA
jgi:hypothetical protein